MPELHNSKMRMVFPPGTQKSYLSKVQFFIDLSNAELAELLKVSVRTLTDWKRGKFSLTLGAAKFLEKSSGIKLPRMARVLEPFWYVNKGAKKGGRAGALACYKKYGYYGGNPDYRKRKWREGWEREGKFKSNTITTPLQINMPALSEELAEYVGIMMGDGGISTTQLVVTLHRIDDWEYGKFVRNLIQRLFNVKPSIYLYPNFLAYRLIVSRVQLVNFCIKQLGLKLGNKIKQNLDIPDWIRGNRKYEIACMRGLVDTDGCIFKHSYRVGRKVYSYKKLSFTSASNYLLMSVYQILKNLDMNPRLARKGGSLKEVRLDTVFDMEKYFTLVGSHNPKHLRKYKN